MHNDKEPHLPHILDRLNGVLPEAFTRPQAIVETKDDGREIHYGFTYDTATGNLIAFTEQLEGVLVSDESRTYDEAGRLVVATTNKGEKTQQVSQAYDDEGRLVSREYRRNSGDRLEHISIETWQYDEQGRLVKSFSKSARRRGFFDYSIDLKYFRDAIFEAATTDYEYDQEGRIIKETTHIDRAEDPTLMEASYFLDDDTANPPRVDDPAIISDIQAWYRDNPLLATKTHEYKGERLVHVSERGGKQPKDLFYDEETGLLVREEYGDTWDDGTVRLYEYDEQGKCVKSSSDDGNGRIEIYHAYDEDGRWVEDYYFSDLDGSRTVVRTCQYDELGRPLSVSDRGSSLTVSYADAA